MNKQTIITILLFLVTVAGQAQVKCHVEGTVAEGTKAVGLVIYRDGTDPKDSPMQLAVKDGRFECDVEDTQIERWHIVDFGEVLEKGMTSRSDAFFSEPQRCILFRRWGDCHHPSRWRQVQGRFYGQGVSAMAGNGASRRCKVPTTL